MFTDSCYNIVVLSKLLIPFLVAVIVAAITFILSYNYLSHFNEPNSKSLQSQTVLDPSPSTLNISPSPSSVTKINSTSPKLMDIEISNDDLNSQVKSSLVGQSLGKNALGDITITDADIAINDGYLLITGTAKNGFISAPFQSKATLEVSNNQPKLNLSNLTLNNIPLPQSVADQLTSVIQSKVTDTLDGYGFKIQAIKLETGKITLVGEK